MYSLSFNFRGIYSLRIILEFRNGLCLTRAFHSHLCLNQIWCGQINSFDDRRRKNRFVDLVHRAHQMSANGRGDFGIWNTVQINPERIFQCIIPCTGQSTFKGFVPVYFYIVIGAAGFKAACEHVANVLLKRCQFDFSLFALIAK